jgi:hypothetical protein
MLTWSSKCGSKLTVLHCTNIIVLRYSSKTGYGHGEAIESDSRSECLQFCLPFILLFCRWGRLVAGIDNKQTLDAKGCGHTTYNQRAPYWILLANWTSQVRLSWGFASGHGEAIESDSRSECLQFCLPFILLFCRHTTYNQRAPYWILLANWTSQVRWVLGHVDSQV